MELAADKAVVVAQGEARTEAEVPGKAQPIKHRPQTLTSLKPDPLHRRKFLPRPRRNGNSGLTPACVPPAAKALTSAQTASSEHPVTTSGAPRVHNGADTQAADSTPAEAVASADGSKNDALTR